MQERTCARDGCDKSFIPKKANQAYCSRGCYLTHAAEAKRRPEEQRECDVCGASFVPERGSQRRCSRECQREGRRRNRLARESPLQTFDQGIEYKTLRIGGLPDGYRVFVLSDIHIPFHDGPTLQCIERFWNYLQPDLEILNGDIVDFYSISKFDKNPKRGFDFADEIEVARSWLHKRVQRNPSARRVFSEGNHEDRLRAWLWRQAPEGAKLRGMSVQEQLDLEELGFEHVTYRSIVDVLGVEIQHGYRASKSDTANPMNVSKLMAQSTQSSGICGHSHALNTYRWRDSRGSHSYREGGCACSMRTVYAPFPKTWAWGFVHGVVRRGQLYLTTIPVYDLGFDALGKFYPRN